MQHQEFEPPEVLRDAIKCFWYDSKDYGALPTGFEVAPDGYAEIIFHFGGELSAYYEGVMRPLPSPFVVGLLNRPVVFYAKNRLEIMAIRCFPWTVFDLLGVPAGRDAVRLLEHPIAQLHPALAEQIGGGRPAAAVAQAMQYFRQARSRVAMDSMLFKAGLAMTAASGTLPVSQVAAAAHATVRTLERKFKQAAGYTVKDVSGVMRFEQVRNHLWFQPGANLAGLAHELGYTDQAHLSREFKRYSGTTPAAFARKGREWQQEVSTDFVAFIQA